MRQKSGIHNLSTINAVTVGTIVFGSYITAEGHFIPLIIGSGVNSIIGVGLIFAVYIESSGKSIGYQVFVVLKKLPIRARA